MPIVVLNGLMRGIVGHIRRVALWVAGAIVGLLVIDPASQFVVAFLQEKGVYEHPVDKVDRMVGWLHQIVSSSIFQWVGGAVIGLCLGLWMDWLSKKTPPKNVSDYLHTGVEQRAAGRKFIAKIEDNHYSDAIFELPQAFGGKFVVEGKHFERCLFVGPAVVTNNQCILTYCVFHHEIASEEIFMELPEERFKYLFNGVLMFKNCTFVDCDFFRLHYIGRSADIAQMRKALSGAN